MDPDADRVIIRLNDEVLALGKLKLKLGVKKKPNEKIYEDEVEDIVDITLTDKDSPNVGHLTMLKLRDNWYIHFDFRQNKGRAKKLFDSALQFFEGAKLCHQNKLDRPFVDNLFSAVELLATAHLFTMSEKDYIKKQTHNRTQQRYNAFINIGNAKSEYKDTLNQLRGLTDAARYLKRPFKLEETDAQKYITIVEDMVTYTRKSIDY